MSNNNVPVPALPAQEAAALDDELELQRYSEFSSSAGRQLATSHFVLSGMTCASCASIIERALHQLPGVAQAHVNAARRRGTVVWDREQLRASNLVAAVRQAGYEAYPDTSIAAQEQRRLELRQMLWRLGVAVFCMMQIMMYATPSYTTTQALLGHGASHLLQWASWLLCLPVLIFSSAPFHRSAFGALRQKRIGMDLPIVLGLWVAFIASTAVTLDPQGPWGHEVYFDSVAMLVSFLLLGRWLEGQARARAEFGLESVLYRLPASVQRLDAQGEVQWIAAARLVAGDRVRVAVGQVFATDGKLIEGSTEVDESLLTGESRLLPRGQGDGVLAGSINQGAPVLMRVEQVGTQTQYERVVALMRQAVNERPAIVRQADHIAAPFLWAVLALALVAALVWWQVDSTKVVGVVVAVLIVTCPCALSLAAPSSLLAAASALARRHVLVQRLEALETLSKVDSVFFDKTGTLTNHQLSLQALRLRQDGHTLHDSTRGQALLSHALGLAEQSSHPLSLALLRSAQEAGLSPQGRWQDVREEAGQGMQARDELGQTWRLGSPAWAAGPTWPMGEPDHLGAQVVFANERGLALGLVFDESVRPDAAQAVNRLKQAGLSVALLSGDQAARVSSIAQALGLTQWHADARPQDKLTLVQQAQARGHGVAVVGDGINDAPVLASADVSFVMGHGAALAQAKADFVIMSSEPFEVAATHELALQTLRVIKQNFAWGVLYNLVSVPAALLGWLPPWAAGLGMASSSLVVVLNALRLSRFQAKPPPDGAAAAPWTLSALLAATSAT